MIILFGFMFILVSLSIIFFREKMNVAKAVYYIFLYQKSVEMGVTPDFSRLNSQVRQDWLTDSRTLLKRTTLFQRVNMFSNKEACLIANSIGFRK